MKYPDSEMFTPSQVAEIIRLMMAWSGSCTPAIKYAFHQVVPQWANRPSLGMVVTEIRRLHAAYDVDEKYRAALRAKIDSRS